MRKQIIYIFFILTLFSFVSAYDLQQQNTTYFYSQTVANADGCNLTTITYPNGSTSPLNLSMAKDGFEFSATILNGNFSQVGDTCWGIVCYDSDASPNYVSSRKCLTVTLSGENPTTANGIANIILITFFVFLIFILHISTKKINFASWRNGLVKKYENRNYVKLVLGSILFNILNNLYLIYYLIGFPIILSITNIVYIFGISSMVDIVGIFLFLYTAGSLIVGLYLFSNVQEWIMDLLKQVQEMEWGVYDEK